MQTTAWLYVFWHGGFPLFVMGYALLRRHEVDSAVAPVNRPGLTTILSVFAVAVLAIVLTTLATAGHDLLPVVMQDTDGGLPG
jgi:hypothetical protein